MTCLFISSCFCLFLIVLTGPDGAVVIVLANGLVGTGFTSRYWFQHRAGF